MALVLDATVGGPASNAYATVAAADLYASYDLRSAMWAAEGADEKIQDLVTAANALDSLSLRGVRATTTQALEFPRTGTDNLGNAFATNVIPLAWRKANIELALFYAAQRAAGVTDVLNPVVSNVSSAASGDDQVDFFKPSDDLSDPESVSQLPLTVQRLVAAFVFSFIAVGWGSASVVRTS